MTSFNNALKCKSVEEQKIYNDLDVLNDCYHCYKRMIFEQENSITIHSERQMEEARRFIAKVEYVINILPEKQKLIITKEFVENKMKTKWYMDYFTPPTYYRNRFIAFKMFISLLQK